MASDRSPFRITIDTAIDLPTLAPRVFEVLADTVSYPEWNPYHVRVEGTLAPGEPLVVDIEKPDGTALTVEPLLLELEPDRTIVWGGGPQRIFRGVHRFDLEPLSAVAELHATSSQRSLLWAVRLVRLARGDRDRIPTHERGAGRAA